MLPHRLWPNSHLTHVMRLVLRVGSHEVKSAPSKSAVCCCCNPLPVWVLGLRTWLSIPWATGVILWCR